MRRSVNLTRAYFSLVFDRSFARDFYFDLIVPERPKRVFQSEAYDYVERDFLTIGNHISHV